MEEKKVMTAREMKFAQGEKMEKQKLTLKELLRKTKSMLSGVVDADYVESLEPAKKQEPAESAKKQEPTKNVESSEPAKKQEPTKNVESSEPAKKQEPTKDVESSEPAKKQEPSKDTKSSDDAKKASKNSEDDDEPYFCDDPSKMQKIEEELSNLKNQVTKLHSLNTQTGKTMGEIVRWKSSTEKVITKIAEQQKNSDLKSGEALERLEGKFERELKRLEGEFEENNNIIIDSLVNLIEIMERFGKKQ